MMRRTLLATALIAALSVPVAFAAPPPGKGKPPATGPGCKPAVTVMLKGKLTSDPGTGATSFTMNVTGTNEHGKSLKGLGVTIMVDAKTRIRRQGAKTIESLTTNDRANVQLRRCKGELPLSAATVDDVAAYRVTAQAPKA